MMKKSLLLIIVLAALNGWSQNNVGIGTLTPATDAVLDLVSTNKGFLAPRVTNAQRLAIPAASNGLLVYDTDDSKFYYWSGAAWQVIDDQSVTNELITAASFNAATKVLSIADNGATYNLDLNILNQDLSFSNDTLYLTDGSQIYLGEYHQDSSSTNELIVTANFNNVTKVISITDQGNTFTQDLSILNQRLSFSNDSISISDGNAIYLGEYHKDSSATNELNTGSSFNATTKEFSITDQGGTITENLSILNQQLNFNNDTLRLSDANQVYLGEFHKDSSTTNELITTTGFNPVTKEYSITDQGNTFTENLGILNQQLNFSNDTLYLSDANQIFLGEFHKDSSNTNEIQALSISNDTLFLERGGFVVLDVRDKWNTEGNVGTGATSFLGTIDNQPLRIRTNNTEKVTVLQNGNVGIGENNPLDRLVVQGGRVEFTAGTDANGAPGTGVLEIGNSLRLDNNEIITNTNLTLSLNNDNNGDIQMDGGTVYVDASTDRLGVGTATPDERLDVNGDIELSGGNRVIHTENAPAGNPGASLTVRASNHNNSGNFAVDGGSLFLQGGNGYNSNQNLGGGHVYLRSGANDLTSGAGQRNGGHIILETGGALGVFNEQARMLDNGNFGLGTAAPTAQLDLTGQIRIRGGAPAAGRVLTSDANGLATWQAAGAGAGDITSVAAGAGLTGGGTTGAVTLTAAANNGLTVNAGADRIQLGGALIQNTTITHGINSMVYNLNGTGDFHVQDAGVNHFSVFDNGNTAFGGDVEWRDENTGGTVLARLFDDGNDGRFIVMENGVTSVDLDANTQFVFNEQGLDRNFRIESDAQASMFFLDAGSNRIGVQTNTPTKMLHMTNGGLAVGANAMAQFDNTSATGVALSGNNTSVTNPYNGVEGITNYGGTANIPCGVFGLAINTSLTHIALGVRGTANGRDGVGVYGSRQNTGGTGYGGAFYSDLGYTGMLGTISDSNTKKNILPLQSAINLVMQLQPVTYNYNLDKYPNMGLSEGKEYGFISQQVERVLPEVVREKSLFTNACEEVKPNQGQKLVSEEFKVMDYTRIIPVLTQAIKEQQDIIDSLRFDLNEIKEGVVKEAKSRTISDFNTASMNSAELFVPFSNEFKSRLQGNAIITITPLNSDIRISVSSQNKDGFVVKVNENFSPLDFNWIAMAKSSL